MEKRNQHQDRDQKNGALHDLTHARHDSSHCLAPGLFRGLLRGERETTKLDVTYKRGEYELQFLGPEPLGGEDLQVLQGLIAMAGPSGLVLSSDPKTEQGRQLRLMLEPRWGARDEDSMMVKGSYQDLIRAIKFTKSKNSTTIQKCIERLYTVTIIVRRGKERIKGYRLLSEMDLDESEGKLFVALNPMLAAAIMGGQHVRILLSEVRALTHNSSRIIHQRLCGWIDQGKSGRVTIDTLCGYVWPTSLQETGQGSGVRMRRSRVRTKALPELQSLGWTVTEYARGKYLISRPPNPEASSPGKAEKSQPNGLPPNNGDETPQQR